jgi:uncharacterized protein
VIVVDASVLANVVGDDGDDGRLARDAVRAGGAFAAPDLVDVETTAVLRKRWLAGGLSDDRFSSAVGDLLDLPFERYPSGQLMRRASELRANVTAYDAAYVALAEGLGCRLLTADARLARAPGPRCPIDVLAPATRGEGVKPVEEAERAEPATSSVAQTSGDAPPRGQRLSFLTLGARDLPGLRRFYNAWGWTELPDGTDDWVAFDAGGTLLALYPLALLGREAAPGVDLPGAGRWNGITLAINVKDPALVEDACRAALAAGATTVAEPQDREWGGRSGYVADPEGNRWEIAWAPNLDASFVGG